MNQYKLSNNVLGWVTFIISIITYTLTLEPTVSFWDCGEFISASYRLQICHPPGAPLFLMIGRVFSLFAADPSKVAFMVNMVSATTSALCVMFTFWTITHLGRKIVNKTVNEISGQQTFAVMAAGLVGALVLTFSDTFWFSAVEAEVYASSSFFTTLTFWCILKWEDNADEKGADRWIVLIAYLIGLAIGVHLLNLLVIPAIVYVYYFKKNKYTLPGFLKASAVAILAIGFVQFGVIPGLPTLATKLDYFTVNSLGMGTNSGALLLIVIMLALMASGLHYTQTNKKTSLYIAIACYTSLVLVSFNINSGIGTLVGWAFLTGLIYIIFFYAKISNAVKNIMVLAFSFIVIGFSSYAMIIIRSLGNPPIDMNDPDQPFALLSYINREQYGDNPLLYGQYFYARPIDTKSKGMNYRRLTDANGKESYVEAGEKLERVYDPKDCTILPRMWADRGDYIQAYRSWENIPEGKKATFGKNIDFLLSYQLGFMYWRYFFWNFVGRQNDDQGYGDATRGNWISGISFIDEWRLGPQKDMPAIIKDNKARNVYFGIPLILGILGLIFHFKKQKEDATVVTTLFLFTGFFIILYLNFPAHQPRERDYAYVGSYQTFIIWIGLGVLAIIDWLSKKMNAMAATAITTIACLLGAPILMAEQNWDDHNRSNRFTALHFAEDYLNSCAKDAILFTNGDNDTYPLWYAQNVENIRSDIRIINLSLLGTDWYADGLRRPAYDGKPVEFSWSPETYAADKRNYVVYYENPALGLNKTDYYDLGKLLQFMGDDNKESQVQLQGGEYINYYPTKRFSVKIDKEACLKNGVVQPEDAALMVDSIKFEISNSSNMLKPDLLTLDIVATNINKRPIYWAITTGSDVYLNMQSHFQMEGLTYRLVPIFNQQDPNDPSPGRINSKILWTNLMTKFKWGNMDQPGVYLDETILRQTKNFRNLFYRLAEQLVREGKKDSAIKALDYCQKVLPSKTIAHDVFSVRLAEGYFLAGSADKANALLREILNTCETKAKYYKTFRSSSKYKLVKPELEENIQIMTYCMQVAQMNQQEAVAKEFTDKLNAISSGL
jgi:hypothetical protein